MITTEQIRAGRAMAGVTKAQLATRVGISTTAMNNIEHGADAKCSTLRAMQAALEKAGVEFIADNGGGPGVRLRKCSGGSIPVEELNASNDNRRRSPGAPRDVTESC